MEGPGRMVRKPLANFLCLVGSAVVQNDVNILSGKSLRRVVQECDELFLPMTEPSNMLSAASRAVVPFRR